MQMQKAQCILPAASAVFSRGILKSLLTPTVMFFSVPCFMLHLFRHHCSQKGQQEARIEAEVRERGNPSSSKQCIYLCLLANLD